MSSLSSIQAAAVVVTCFFQSSLRHTLDSGQTELAPGAWKTSVQFFSRRGGGREEDVPAAAEHAASLSYSHCSTESGCRGQL